MKKRSGFCALLLYLLFLISIVFAFIFFVESIYKGFSLSILFYYVRCTIASFGALICVLVLYLMIMGKFVDKTEIDGAAFFSLFLWGFVLFYVVMPNKKPLSVEEKLALHNQNEQQKIQKEENLKKELIAFSKDKIPELYNAINETSRMREEITNKREKITEVLKKLGRDYRTDEDIRRYDDLLKKLNVADIEYDKMLKEGYLQYKKFEIFSDPAYEKMLENYNNKAKLSLEENVDSFNKMRNKLSEKRNNE